MWLARNTYNTTLTATASRMQVFPQITIITSSASTRFEHRTRGAIAGSCVAETLGRILVETALRDNTNNHLHHGLTFDAMRVQQFSLVGNLVDNLVAAGLPLAIRHNYSMDWRRRFRTNGN